jgi:hypothetical protein
MKVEWLKHEIVFQVQKPSKPSQKLNIIKKKCVIPVHQRNDEVAVGDIHS